MFEDWIGFMETGEPVAKQKKYYEFKCVEEENIKQIYKDKTRLDLTKDEQNRFETIAIHWHHYHNTKERRPCYAQDHGPIIALLIKYIPDDDNVKRVWSYLLKTHLRRFDIEDMSYSSESIKSILTNEQIRELESKDLLFDNIIIQVFIAFFRNEFNIYYLDFIMSAPVNDESIDILYFLINACILDLQSYELEFTTDAITKHLNDGKKDRVYELCNMACTLRNEYYRKRSWFFWW
jgi:hypothetical protein